jgi:hypothetical protein
MKELSQWREERRGEEKGSIKRLEWGFKKGPSMGFGGGTKLQSYKVTSYKLLRIQLNST